MHFSFCYGILFLMAFHVITNPGAQRVSGFTQAAFRRLDEIYRRAGADKKLMHRAVDCDFDAGVATFSYCKTPDHPPCLAFVIRRVGPQTVMYELYREKSGRIAKSGLFSRVLDRLKEEVDGIES